MEVEGIVDERVVEVTREDPQHRRSQSPPHVVDAVLAQTHQKLAEREDVGVDLLHVLLLHAIDVRHEIGHLDLVQTVREGRQLRQTRAVRRRVRGGNQRGLHAQKVETGRLGKRLQLRQNLDGV